MVWQQQRHGVEGAIQVHAHGVETIRPCLSRILQEIRVIAHSLLAQVTVRKVCQILDKCLVQRHQPGTITIGRQVADETLHQSRALN